MTEKFLGKIKSAEFGVDPDYPCFWGIVSYVHTWHQWGKLYVYSQHQSRMQV